MSTIRFYDAEKAIKEISVTQQKSIRRMYENLAKDIDKEIASLSTKSNVSSILRTQYLNELKGQLKSESNKISKEIESSIKNAMEQTSQVLVDENNRFLKSIGLDIKGSYSYVPKDIVERISTGKIYDSDWSLSKAIWNSNKKVNDDINSIIARGVAENKPTYDIAKDLEKYVNPAAKKDWEWSKVYPNTSKVVDYNAQRLARTMISHAYQQSFIATTKDNPFFTGYKWISGHTTRTCEVCIARESNDEYGMGAGVFPKDELPIDHPNGLCTYGVVTDGDLSSISDRIANWYNSPDGTYPEIDNYANSLQRGATGSTTNTSKSTTKKSTSSTPKKTTTATSSKNPTVSSSSKVKTPNTDTVSETSSNSKLDKLMKELEASKAKTQKYVEDLAKSYQKAYGITEEEAMERAVKFEQESREKVRKKAAKAKKSK